MVWALMCDYSVHFWKAPSKPVFFFLKGAIYYHHCRYVMMQYGRLLASEAALYVNTNAYYQEMPIISMTFHYFLATLSN